MLPVLTIGIEADKMAAPRLHVAVWKKVGMGERCTTVIDEVYTWILFGNTQKLTAVRRVSIMHPKSLGIRLTLREARKIFQQNTQ